MGRKGSSHALRELGDLVMSNDEISESSELMQSWGQAREASKVVAVERQTLGYIMDQVGKGGGNGGEAHLAEIECLDRLGDLGIFAIRDLLSVLVESLQFGASLV